MSACCVCCVAAWERGECDHEPGSYCLYLPCDFCPPLEFFTDEYGRAAYRYLASFYGTAAGSECLVLPAPVGVSNG